MNDNPKHGSPTGWPGLSAGGTTPDRGFCGLPHIPVATSRDAELVALLRESNALHRATNEKIALIVANLNAILRRLG